MASPVEEMLTKLRAEHARSNNPQQAEQRQRRERLLPYVKAKADPDSRLASPTKIITLLLKGKGFRKRFEATARRTLDNDAEARSKNSGKPDQCCRKMPRRLSFSSAEMLPWTSFPACPGRSSTGLGLCPKNLREEALAERDKL